MPGKRGTDLLSTVAKRYPETVRILLTGHSTLDVAVRAINQGEVYRFLTKPCDPTEIALAIREGLAQREVLRGGGQLPQAPLKQSAVIEDLERQWKGITHVERDSDGAVILSDVPIDLDGLSEPGSAAKRDRPVREGSGRDSEDS
jgi:DNA-binding NtrC family response regulator